MGTYLKRINSPRYTNENTINKNKADDTAHKYHDILRRMRNTKSTFMTFSDHFPAYDPLQNKNEIKYFISFTEVGTIIRNLKNKIFYCLDKIPSIVIKNLPLSIITEYRIIFDNAINHVYYPNRWKQAKVLPILKKGKNPEKPQSYRPIMNTSKIFEKIIKKNMDHINVHNIIPNNQFGFKSNLSTTHAIYKLTSDLNNYLHNEYAIGAVLLDLEKMFDSIWKNGLIHKLDDYKFSVSLILLIANMIEGKTFRTWNGTNFSSKSFKISKRLQQGTVTDPIQHIQQRSVKQIKYSAVTKIDNLKLTTIDIHTNELTEIPKKRIVKYLGVHIDHLLKLNKHYSVQLDKAKKAFKLNSRIFYSKNLTTKAKIICYGLLVRSILTYAVPILWNTGPTIIEKIRRFERFCLRSCLRKHRTAESDYKRRIKNETVYNNANINRIDCFSLKITRKYFNNIDGTNNSLITNLISQEEDSILSKLNSGYFPPELFIYCDKNGLIQNHNNLPLKYHRRRHSA
ncbi:uncharacterized protein LOC124431579 [Vespa crabro]|uniref:uncharacterized protein LOC124431579 n=1 Tax=Vespa crabro TaxID=7445 RepID=UPI001F013023|nr:uncharacterized protein LOC124431579 [Vespa crabro]